MNNSFILSPTKHTHTREQQRNKNEINQFNIKFDSMHKSNLLSILQPNPFTFMSISVFVISTNFNWCLRFRFFLNGANAIGSCRFHIVHLEQYNNVHCWLVRSDRQAHQRTTFVCVQHPILLECVLLGFLFIRSFFSLD